MAALWCCTIFFIVGGLLCIFAHDFMWQLTEEMHRMNGTVSQRTPEWDDMTSVIGFLSLLGAGFSLMLIVSG